MEQINEAKQKVFESINSFLDAGIRAFPEEQILCDSEDRWEAVKLFCEIHAELNKLLTETYVSITLCGSEEIEQDFYEFVATDVSERVIKLSQKAEQYFKSEG